MVNTSPLVTDIDPPHNSPVSLSIVIAVFNEQDNIAPVCYDLLCVSNDAEIIFVNDGSTDKTLDELILARRNVLPRVRILSHNYRQGKSTALKTGIRAAREQWIATMDGDGQDDPREIPPLLALAIRAGEPVPIVVGLRVHRKDCYSRRLATRFANNLRNIILRDGCPDTGAPIKIFRKQDFLDLPYFEGMHRFLPALFRSYGHPVIGQQVQHRPRLHGQSKYTNFNRSLVGIRDLIGVSWLVNRTHNPGNISEI